MWQIAHRGYSDIYGDNNMKSFHEAIQAGFDMIELDIQLCASGEIVVFHDIFLQGQYISEMSYHDLKQHNIVLLETVFMIFHNRPIRFFLDVKGDHSVVETMVPLLQRWFPANDMQRIYVSGFGRYIVDPLVISGLKVHIGLTTENMFTPSQLDALIENCDFVCIHWTALLEETIQCLQENGIMVFSYTGKDDFSLNHMRKFALDGIVSNYPIPH